MAGVRGRESGTSMVEVLIAMAVLAFVLLAFLSIMHSASSLSAGSKEAAIASYQLQAALEHTFSVTFDEFKANFTETLAPPPAGSDDAHPNGTERGHFAGQPLPVLGDRMPDFCQREMVNRTRESLVIPTGSPTLWVSSNATSGTVAPRLPLRNQHVWIEWVDQDPAPDPKWIEYRIWLQWTDHRGRTRTESILTKRSE